ncbi:MAG: hypothetical protein ACREUT_21795 [Steroidobacteraceae bacterium]
MNASPGARAVSIYQIEDVFLLRSEVWVARDFNPFQPMPEFTFGHSSGVENECIAQERTDPSRAISFHILRYFVGAEIRLLRPGVELDKEEPAEGSILAVLKFTLAADYRCPKEALEDKDAIGAFSRNAHFHAWPYMREEVHAACARLRIPRITLPMLKPDGSPFIQAPSVPSL